MNLIKQIKDNLKEADTFKIRTDLNNRLSEVLLEINKVIEDGESSITKLKEEANTLSLKYFNMDIDTFNKLNISTIINLLDNPETSKQAKEVINLNNKIITIRDELSLLDSTGLDTNCIYDAVISGESYFVCKSYKDSLTEKEYRSWVDMSSTIHDPDFPVDWLINRINQEVK